MTNTFLAIAGLGLATFIIVSNMILTEPGFKRSAPSAVRHTRSHHYKLPPRG